MKDSKSFRKSYTTKRSTPTLTFQSQEDLLNDDIEEDPDLKYVSGLVAKQQQQGRAQHSSPPSISSFSSSSRRVQSPPSSTSTSPSSSFLKTGGVSLFGNKLSQSSSTTSQKSPATSQTNSYQGSSSQMNNNYDDDEVEEEEDGKFICILDSVCSDWSDEHLKEYCHKTRGKPKQRTTNGNYSKVIDKGGVLDKKQQIDIKSPSLSSPPYQHTKVQSSPTLSHPSPPPRLSPQRPPIEEEDDSDILSVTQIKDIVNRKNPKNELEKENEEKEKEKEKHKEKDNNDSDSNPIIIKKKSSTPLSTSSKSTSPPSSSGIDTNSKDSISSIRTDNSDLHEVIKTPTYDISCDVLKRLPEFKKKKKNTSPTTSSTITTTTTSTTTTIHSKIPKITYKHNFFEEEIEDDDNKTPSTTTSSSLSSISSISSSTRTFKNDLLNNHSSSTNIKSNFSTNNNHSGKRKEFDDQPLYQQPAVNKHLLLNENKKLKQNISTTKHNFTATPSSEIWIDKYAPKSEEELVVHKKKISEVKIWLQGRFDEMSKNVKLTEKMLILTGQSGIGKSAMIKTLVNSGMAFSLDEWINPSVQYTIDRDNKGTCPYTPPLESFKSWLESAGRHDLFGGNRGGRKKMMLIEEFPNLSNKDQEREFRQMFQRYIDYGKYPLVFIVSDLNTGNSPLHRLFDPNFLNSPLIKKISINAVPPATMAKFLTMIAKTEGYEVEQEHIDLLVQESAGDIRAAINNLEFHCIGQTRKMATNKKETKTKRGKKPGHVDSSQQQRNPNLSLFHSLGKILYNKRIPPTDNESNIWYQDKYYRLPMENVPEEVYEQSHIDGSLYTLFLHENFLSFYTDIDEVSDSMSYLSVADEITRISVHEPIENIYQENPYAISVVLRGLMYPHCSPTTRSFHQFVKPHFQGAHAQSIQLDCVCKEYVYTQLLQMQNNPYLSQSTTKNLVNPLHPGDSPFNLPTSLLGNLQLMQETLPFLSLMQNYSNIFTNNPSPLLVSFIRSGRSLLDKVSFNQLNYNNFGHSKENQIRERSDGTFIHNLQEEEDNDNNSKKNNNNGGNDNNINNNNNNNNSNGLRLLGIQDLEEDIIE